MRGNEIARLYMRAGEMGLAVESTDLPRDICGLYDDRHGLILLADWLNQRQRRCTLCHELIHAKYHDSGCGSQYGIKCERRCRRETALALISPVDYGMAEEVYEGNMWMMAVELGVTIQVLNDYRQLLYDSGVCVQ
ncbi:ImmA/IrrE family metallo-endopeptidase [Bifidobacterium pongonis]|uniref:ImmA/IrrE family metallo-endopeptidase n=1 Tax=Bifidobacterium pongonis TaxID=2834432 RepID=UPI001F42B6CE|nr:ImmA/IrrE family metallo-endopeptidase [Bifidobacterium pongonis]